MPKDRSTSSLRSRASQYSYGTKNDDSCRLRNGLQSVVHEKEWEEARCPVCMEHPHNAVLLLCTSHENGCRPYVCDTSSRHSNCFDQYLKSPAANPSDNTTDEESSVLGRDHEPRYLCPLCRGEFTSWIVVEAARKFMNANKRSCSLETCSFSGTYQELRNHARDKHRSSRPSEADPQRVVEWTRLEQESDLQDALIQDQYEGGDDDITEDMAELVAEVEGFIFDSPPRQRNNISFPLNVGVERPFTLFLSRTRVTGFTSPPPRQRNNISGQSGGGGGGVGWRSRTSARMSVRDNSGRHLAVRRGRRSYRGQRPSHRD